MSYSGNNQSTKYIRTVVVIHVLEIVAWCSLWKCGACHLPKSNKKFSCHREIKRCFVSL